MQSFREQLDAAEALLGEAQDAPADRRMWLLAVVCERLGDLIADLDAAIGATAGGATAGPPPQPRHYRR